MTLFWFIMLINDYKLKICNVEKFKIWPVKFEQWVTSRRLSLFIGYAIKTYIAFNTFCQFWTAIKFHTKAWYILKLGWINTNMTCVNWWVKNVSTSWRFHVRVARPDLKIVKSILYVVFRATRTLPLSLSSKFSNTIFSKTTNSSHKSLNGELCCIVWLFKGK